MQHNPLGTTMQKSGELTPVMAPADEEEIKSFYGGVWEETEHTPKWDALIM